MLEESKQVTRKYTNIMLILFILSLALAVATFFIPLYTINLVLAEKNVFLFDVVPFIGEFAPITGETFLGSDFISDFAAWGCFIMFIFLILVIIAYIIWLFKEDFKGCFFRNETSYLMFYHSGNEPMTPPQAMIERLTFPIGFFCFVDVTLLILCAVDTFVYFNFDFETFFSFEIIGIPIFIPAILQIVLCIAVSQVKKAWMRSDAGKFVRAHNIAKLNDTIIKQLFTQSNPNLVVKCRQGWDDIMRKENNPFYEELLKYEGQYPTEPTSGNTSNSTTTESYHSTYSTSNPPPATPAHNTGQETVELLKQYKQLLDDGILTEEEFQAKKEDLLKKSK